MKNYGELTFEESLSFGKEVEEYVLSRIHKKYPKAFIRDGNHKEWDIFVPEAKLRIEVKADIKSNQTNKFVVETSFGGRPSALTTSTADLWVFFDGSSLIWITKENIKKAINQAGIKLLTFVGGSDIKSKTAYLVPKRFLRDLADKVDYPLTDLPSNFKFN